MLNNVYKIRAYIRDFTILLLSHVSFSGIFLLSFLIDHPLQYPPWLVIEVLNEMALLLEFISYFLLSMDLIANIVLINKNIFQIFFMEQGTIILRKSMYRKMVFWRESKISFRNVVLQYFPNEFFIAIQGNRGV